MISPAQLQAFRNAAELMLVEEIRSAALRLYAQDVERKLINEILRECRSFQICFREDLRELCMFFIEQGIESPAHHSGVSEILEYPGRCSIVRMELLRRLISLGKKDGTE